MAGSRTEIEFGDDPPAGLAWGRSTPLGRKLHLVPFEDRLALCGVYVGGPTERAEHMSGYLCEKCETTSDAVRTD